MSSVVPILNSPDMAQQVAQRMLATLKDQRDKQHAHLTSRRFPDPGDYGEQYGAYGALQRAYDALEQIYNTALDRKGPAA